MDLFCLLMEKEKRHAEWFLWINSTSLTTCWAFFSIRLLTHQVETLLLTRCKLSLPQSAFSLRNRCYLSLWHKNTVRSISIWTPTEALKGLATLFWCEQRQNYKNYHSQNTYGSNWIKAIKQIKIKEAHCLSFII